MSKMHHPPISKLRANKLDCGAAVLLIGHDRKAGDAYAGSHVIRAAAKHALRLARPSNCRAESADDPRRELHVIGKLEGGSSHILKINGVGDWAYIGEPGAIGESDIEQKVEAAVLASNEPASADELAKQIAADLST